MMICIDRNSKYIYPLFRMTRQTAPDRDKVRAHFDSSATRVYRASEIADLQIEHGEDWKVPARMGKESFREWLLKNTELTEVKLKSRSYPALIRYTWTERCACGLDRPVD
jgi:hypothetical protein